MLLSSVIWGALALAQGSSVSTEELFNGAATALRAGQLDEAEKGFRAVLVREPRNLGALGNLGVILNRRNRPEEAIAVYKRALALAPREPGLELNLGLAYLKQNQPALALPCFQSVAARPGPLNAQAEELRLSTLVQSGQARAAIDRLRRLAENPAANSAIVHALAAAHVQLGERDLAQLQFERLLKMLPAAHAHMMEGQVWYDTSVFDRAAKCYRDAAAAGRPDGVERELGKTLLSLRENAEAEAQFRAALARDPDDLEAQYFLGAMLVQAGNPAAGQGYLESVARHRPGLWGTYYYLGKARLASGQARAAIPLLQEAARRAPGEVPVQYQLARALQAAGRKAEAARAFKSIGDKQARAADEKIALR